MKRAYKDRETDARSSYTAADSLQLKMLLDKDLMANVAFGRIPPIHIQFIPTNRCNLNCTFCSCSDRSKGQEMGLGEAKEMIFYFKSLGTKAVTITGGGEPLKHPDIEEIIRTFVDANIKMGLVSNGSLLPTINPRVLDKLTWCRISNSDERRFTDKYRTGLIETVENAPHVDWAFSHVLSNEPNIDEIVKIVTFANDYNFTHVRLVSDLFHPKTVPMEEVRKRLLERGVDDKKVIYQGRKEWTPGQDCYIGYLKPLIGADSNVYLCCLDKNESVLINKKGVSIPVKISDIEVGDFAWGNGIITNKTKTLKPQGLKITLQNNRSIVTSFDHKMIVARNPVIKNKRQKTISDFELIEIESNKLKVGELIPVRIQVPLVTTDTDVSVDFNYIIGLYIADGWLIEKSNAIGFSLGFKKIEALNRLINWCNTNSLKYNITKRESLNQIMVYIGKENIEYFKLCGVYCENKQIPSFVFESDKYYQEFLSGYITGDGCITKPSKGYKNFKVTMSTVSKKLASDLVYLLMRMGIIASLREEKRDKMQIQGRIVDCKNRYHIVIGGSYNLSKLSFLEDSYITEKRSPKRALGFMKTEEVMLVPIKSLEVVEGGEMYDITIEGTGMFYSSLGILTHNCGVQYALPNPAKDLPEELSLGNWRKFGDLDTSKGCTAGNQCVKCYYKSYNDLLRSLLSNIEHKEFL